MTYIFQDSNHDHLKYGKRIVDIWYVAEGKPGGLVPREIEYLRAEPAGPEAPNEIRFIAKARAPIDFYLRVFVLYEDEAK